MDRISIGGKIRLAAIHNFIVVQKKYAADDSFARKNLRGVQHNHFAIFHGRVGGGIDRTPKKNFTRNKSAFKKSARKTFAIFEEFLESRFIANCTAFFRKCFPENKNTDAEFNADFSFPKHSQKKRQRIFSRRFFAYLVEIKFR